MTASGQLICSSLTYVSS